ncbi:Gluconate transport-inducing protein [Coemansia erecta]|nr:Gluconate transport-inducing protein [Coemansia erecta]
METYYGFVSTSEDALALFEACRLGYKQRVPRRLSDDERAAIRSGSVFVWEEAESGMKRWTDGRSWSPSRVQGCFLTYHEWEGRRRAQRHPSYHAMPGFSMPMNIQGMPANGQPFPMGIARYGHFIGGPTKAGSTQVQYGFPKENGMLKKALSIRTTDGKKLHIIAYYSKEDHAMRRLLTPTTDPNFPRLVVPPNLYPDMSPESMYGASHSINHNGMSNEPDYMGPATADPANLQAYEEAMGGNRSGSSSIVSSSGGGNNGMGIGIGMDMDMDMGMGSGLEGRRDTMVDMHPRSAHPYSGMAMDISNMNHPGMHSSPASANPYPQQSRHHPLSLHHHYQQQQQQQQQQQPPHMRRRPSSPSEHLRMPSISATTLSDNAAKAAAASAAAAVDAISAGLHKARVQSLVMDTDIPTPSSLMTSRPAPEQETPQHRVLPLSAPSSSGTRPTSNSFSGSSEGRMRLSRGSNALYERPLGLSTSSSSAPASSVTRPSAAVGTAVSNSMLSIGPHAQAIVSEATDMQQAPLSAERRSLAADHGTRSSSSSSASSHGDGKMATAAIDEVPDLPPMPNTAVPVFNSNSKSNSGSGSRGAKYLGLGGPLGLSSMSARRSNNMRSVTTAAVMVSSSYASGAAGPKLPLLLSPINAQHLSSDFADAAPNISLAGISRDVKEGPRRLPSISANLQSDSPPPSSTTSSSAVARHSCVPGGLGIFNAPVSASSRTSSLLPSPMPTPRQSMPRGFDGDSLSLLAASAADRAHPPPPQFRHASSSYRSTNPHHPYSRSQRRGPSMRSVSLKQSEDIRQLGVLDQGLKLK